MIKFLDLKKQYESIKAEIDYAIQSVINESAFIGGKYVQAFEEEFASYQQTQYCVGMANGTDAIEIAIEALELPKGSEIIVPANSFIATSESVTRSGHRVVFCDCDANNYTISIASLKSKITDATSAIIAVHLYGHPCDMGAINSLAAQHNLKVIEDCAQAHGGEYQGKRVGGLGNIGTFSFFPGKNLGAYGDGGAIVCNDQALATRCRMLANHGRIKKYDHQIEGRNSRLDGLQAAILSVKLKHLEKWTEQRIQIARAYCKGLEGVSSVKCPRTEEWARNVFHLFVIRTNHRDDLQKFLEANSIQSGIHYPIALPKLQAYTYLHQDQEAFFANRNDDCLLSLPIGDHMDEESVNIVCQAITKWSLSVNTTPLASEV
ncbi:MAG: erythromycin biosynthesis sensory transduction protein eryC1 [Candidatus Riflebacteria bacterium HGW-Riflebacteria-1]|jgi:dTDP-4-amino-4,6-dideoxygalactose transaminase|nr:MAG: erythromycin biosynthesis sensory transduction protein eryC1 [Candidatus Riflebacteria bacterium HGW-Riflebacteria-1]